VVSPDLWLLWPLIQTRALFFLQEFLPQGSAAVARSVVTPVLYPYFFNS